MILERVDGIKQEEEMTNSISNDTEEWNTFNAGDTTQKYNTGCTDSMNEDSPNMDNIQAGFTYDRTGINYDCVTDIKEECTSENSVENYDNNFDNIDVKEEGASHYNENDYMDNSRENYESIDVNIKKEITSETEESMDNIRENCSWDNVNIKEEITDFYMDDGSEEGSPYHHGNTEQLQEHDETKGVEKAGKRYISNCIYSKTASILLVY